MKTKYLWHGGEWVEAARFARPERRGPMIISDMEPYQSQVTGEWITSRSRHRQHLAETGCEEGGNELATAMERPKRDLEGEIKADVVEAIQKVSSGYRPERPLPLAHPDISPEITRMI